MISAAVRVQSIVRSGSEMRGQYGTLALRLGLGPGPRQSVRQPLRQAPRRHLAFGEERVVCFVERDGKRVLSEDRAGVERGVEHMRRHTPGFLIRQNGVEQRIRSASQRQRRGMDVDAVSDVLLPAADQPGIARDDEGVASGSAQPSKIAHRDARELDRDLEVSGARRHALVRVVNAAARAREQLYQRPAFAEQGVENVREEVDARKGEPHACCRI